MYPLQSFLFMNLRFSFQTSLENTRITKQYEKRGNNLVIVLLLPFLYST